VSRYGDEIMGDHVAETPVQENLMRMAGELQNMHDQLRAEKERQDARFMELEKKLEEEQAARRKAEEEAEEYRRLAEKFYVEAHREELMKDWENFDPSEYIYTFEDIMADLENLPEWRNAAE
jgi:multidrug resistance efflux pump